MALSKNWVNPAGVEGLIRTKGLYLGTNVKNGRGVMLNAKLLDTHIHIMGPPGVGKSRLLLWIFQLLCRIPNAAVFVLSPKGELARQCRNWAMGHGQTKRLTWFDPADEEHVLGWNPLAPNGLRPATHAKAAREALLAAWGQTHLDDTPQLARVLFLGLFVARELTLTIIEALRLLLPGSGLRQALLPRIQDPYVQEALGYLDSLRAQRQDELVASAVARLEAFVMDSVIRRVLTQQEHTVDFGQVIASRGVFISNTELYKPLRSSDVRLLNRLMINDLLSHVFNRPAGRRTPVYCLIDEVHMVATEDLCVALELGRELGFHCILAHQHPRQLRGEDGNSMLYDSVANCARTKVVFGGLSVENMEALTRELYQGEFDPWRVKDELTGLEVEPMDSWTMQVARTENWTTSKGHTLGASTTETEGDSHTWSRQEGVAESDSESESSGTSSSEQALAGVGETVLPSGDVVASTSQLTGGGEGSFAGAARSHSRTVSTTHGAAETKSSSRSRGTHEATSQQDGRGGAVTRTLVPITHHRKRRVVTSRTFLPQEEFMALKLQETRELPQAHFVLKTPHSPAVILRGPRVDTPKVSERRRREYMARVYAQACYSTPDEIDAEEQRRNVKLLETLQPQPVLEESDMSPPSPPRAARRRLLTKGKQSR